MRIDLIAPRIVLGYDDIGFANFVSLPGCQTHIGGEVVSPSFDKFRRGHAGGGAVKLVLNNAEKPCGFPLRDGS